MSERFEGMYSVRQLPSAVPPKALRNRRLSLQTCRKALLHSVPGRKTQGSMGEGHRGSCHFLAPRVAPCRAAGTQTVGSDPLGRSLALFELQMSHLLVSPLTPDQRWE